MSEVLSSNSAEDEKLIYNITIRVAPSLKAQFYKRVPEKKRSLVVTRLIEMFLADEVTVKLPEQVF
jgi:hypothetical protein